MAEKLTKKSSMKQLIFFFLLSFLTTYSTILAQEVVLKSSNIPIFIIETEGEIKDEPKVDGTLGIIANEEGALNYIDDPFSGYDGIIGIEKRGNSSLSFDKKSYLFETRKASGANNNVELLGLPKENDWILYAPFIDKSLLRNVLMYDLANDLGQYAPRTRFCELVINGEYLGVYILTEKIKRDKNRVNVTEYVDESQTPNDIGYIVRIDSWWQEHLGWKSPAFTVDGIERISRFQYVYPKYDDITEGQKEYIETYITDFEQELWDTDIPNLYDAYSKYIDINSFVDHLILTELSKNPDGYRLSTYLHKEVNGKLKMGPVWDYNFAFGNYWGYEDRYDGWEHDNNWWDYISGIPFWWEKFMQDPVFVGRLHERWNFWRAELLRCERIEQKIDHWTTELDQAQKRNFTKWDNLGEDVHIDWNIGDTYEDEVDYLKRWVCGRIEWMDSEINALQEKHTDQFFSLYPNPTAGLCNLAYQSTIDTEAIVSLVNMQGTLLFEQTYPIVEGSQQLELDFSKFGTGCYILTCTIDGKSSYQTIVIE